VLSTGGVAVVVVSGGNVDITAAGIAFALGAAACFTAYLLVSDRVVHRTHAGATAAWVAAGAALSLLVRGAVTADLDSPACHWPELVGNGIATAAAFGFMFAALQRIGATRTAVVMTFEAFAAAGLGALVLEETLGGPQLVGGVAIVTGALLVTLAAPQPEPVPEL
jgi:drug/metabolite transporter (DMT)-like permease